MATPTTPTPEELDEQLEIAAGRRAPYTQLGDWVALSGISSHAKALYWHLSMHINQQRGDFRVWPTRYVLAEWLGFDKATSVDRYIAELVEIGAIEKYTKRSTNRMRRRNVYVVHQEPPPAYTGPRSLVDDYATRVASSSVPNSSEFGKTAGHTVVPSRGPREVLSRGPREVLSRGPREVPWKGQEPEEKKPDEVKPPPSSGSRTRESSVTPQQPEGVGEVPSSRINPEVIEMLNSIPIPRDKRKPGWRSAKLATVAARCSEIVADDERYGGLTLRDLHRHLSSDLDTAQSVVSVWAHRLTDEQLPAPEQRRSTQHAGLAEAAVRPREQAADPEHARRMAAEIRAQLTRRVGSPAHSGSATEGLN